ncbi:(2Fe-2S)-binding protein [Paracoccus onubensis]|uniref:(2Fe-2S)-binding protein n=2 Tax=Paracoccus onubensis TaxID=1675788 RepID=A0A418T2K4_9RHOB|nr:(2Fe-2S)-binding protein [Paracoccus onubensis]
MPRFRHVPGIQPGQPVDFTFNGTAMSGHQGESIASALLRAGILSQRISPRDAGQRGYYCGMGQCWECAVRIDGRRTVRSCMEPLAHGMTIFTADEGIS